MTTWEDKFREEFEEGTYYGKDIDGVPNYPLENEYFKEDLLSFIRQTIKQERAEAVREVIKIIEKGWTSDELIEEIKNLK